MPDALAPVRLERQDLYRSDGRGANASAAPETAMRAGERMSHWRYRCRPAFEWLLFFGRIDRKHEITLFRWHAAYHARAKPKSRLYYRFHRARHDLGDSFEWAEWLLADDDGTLEDWAFMLDKDLDELCDHIADALIIQPFRFIPNLYGDQQSCREPRYAHE